MDVTNDILVARLVFGTGLGRNDEPFTSRIVRLDDAKSEAQEVFFAHSDYWEAMGMKVLRVRRSTSTVFDNAEKLVQHATVVEHALSPIVVIYYIASSYKEAPTSSLSVLLT